MKRSAALIPLSHDHQHALDAALRLRRADPATVSGAVSHFLDFFEAEGRRHFEIEEDVLVPALPADDPAWSAGVSRLLDDHAALRAMAGEVEAAPQSVELARGLGERLNAHVRFEERELFVMLEERLPASELERIGAEIARRES